MSSASSVRSLLEAYAAGRAPPDRVAAAVAAAYYAAPPGAREPLREIVEIVEREAPGLVELAAQAGGRGFELRPVNRPFPAAAEPDLRRAARALLETSWGAGGPTPAARPAAVGGWWVRLLRAVRRAFSAPS
jgi:hypothetical protein